MRVFATFLLGLVLGAGFVLGYQQNERLRASFPHVALPAPVAAAIGAQAPKAEPLGSGLKVSESEPLMRVLSPAFVRQEPAPAPTPLSFDAAMRAQAWPTVREMRGGEGSCSAVAIRPNFAVTAYHCNAVGSGVSIGGIPVKPGAGKQIGALDVMLVEVPGLRCPCAALATDEIRADEKVASIGFPEGLGGKLMAVGTTQSVVTSPDNGVKFWMHTAYSGPGMSGGGLFALRGGHVVLLALTKSGKEGVLTLVSDVTGLADYLKPVEVWPQ